MSGERMVRAQLLRLGEQLLTRDGWQTIRGLLIFDDSDQVTVFTDERDDDRTSGWGFTLADHVISRPGAGADSAVEQGVTESCDIAAGPDGADRAGVTDVGNGALSTGVTGNRGKAAGLDGPGRAVVPNPGDNALSRDVPGDMPCPAWCTEHYEGEAGGWNHASYPESVVGANVWTGEPTELGYWVERRDDPDVRETVIVLEVSKLAGDIELTPDALRVFAARLLGLAARADRGAR